MAQPLITFTFGELSAWLRRRREEELADAQAWGMAVWIAEQLEEEERTRRVLAVVRDAATVPSRVVSVRRVVSPVEPTRPTDSQGAGCPATAGLMTAAEGEGGGEGGR